MIIPKAGKDGVKLTLLVRLHVDATLLGAIRQRVAYVASFTFGSTITLLEFYFKYIITET